MYQEKYCKYPQEKSKMGGGGNNQHKRDAGEGGKYPSEELRGGHPAQILLLPSSSFLTREGTVRDTLISQHFYGYYWA